jgi:hypothetical protein
MYLPWPDPIEPPPFHRKVHRNEAVCPLKLSFFKAGIKERFSDRLEEGGRARENIHSGFNPFSGISNRTLAK